MGNLRYVGSNKYYFLTPLGRRNARSRSAIRTGNDPRLSPTPVEAVQISVEVLAVDVRIVAAVECGDPSLDALAQPLRLKGIPGWPLCPTLAGT
jgi:hypothetical protein